MKITKSKLRQVIKETLQEGDVIDFPLNPKVSGDGIQRIISLEDEVARLLANFYGNHAEIPVAVSDALDTFINTVEQEPL